MTDRTDQTDHHDETEVLDELETADPSDAPEIAEELADRLAAELDGTGSRPRHASGPRS